PLLRRVCAVHIDLGAASPLLELQRSQAVTDRFVVIGEDAWRVRQLEVLPPPRQILAQFRDHPSQAPSAAASSYLPHPPASQSELGVHPLQRCQHALPRTP